MSKEETRGVTYPPEMLPSPEEGEEAEVVIVHPDTGRATVLATTMREMSEMMVERTAKAIYDCRNGAGATPWWRQSIAHKTPYLKDARAAIEAMRKPTEAMTEAGADSSILDTDIYNVASASDYAKAWRVMIDAALTET